MTSINGGTVPFRNKPLDSRHLAFIGPSLKPPAIRTLIA